MIISFIWIPTRSFPVYVFKKVVLNWMTKRIQYKVYALSSCQFRGRNKICVASNKNDLFYLLFIGKRGYINTNFHIDALLLDRRNKVLIR